MKKFVWISTIVTMALAGCTNPMDAMVPIGKKAEGTVQAEAFKEAIATLTAEEQKQVLEFAIRASLFEGLSGTPWPDTTIGEALVNQKKWEEDERAKVVTEAAEQAKQAAEAKALRDAEEAKIKKIKSMMSAYMVAKDLIKANYRAGEYQDRIAIRVVFQNNTDRVIVGAKGSLEVFNSLGDRITGITIPIEYDIAAGERMQWNGSLDYNQFMEDHVQLMQSDMDRIKTEWLPSMIMFADGTVERLEGAE